MFASLAKFSQTWSCSATAHWEATDKGFRRIGRRGGEWFKIELRYGSEGESWRF